jgi:hypothetical protein
VTPGGIRWGLKDFRQLVACGLGVGSSPDSWWMSLAESPHPADRTLKSSYEAHLDSWWLPDLGYLQRIT